MRKIALYGKGGIGKSTVCSNLAAVWAKQGWKVMQIGCDPKADSTLLLRGGKPQETILDLIRKYKNDFTLDQMVTVTPEGVICVEAGGPVPGLGCAGRGIIAALEKLEEKGAYKAFDVDRVLYDVLGDVVCGGFTMPMRKGYADQVYIVTSGERMSVYAAGNIAMALENFKSRSYAELGGFILNERNVPSEKEEVLRLAEDFHSTVTGILHRSPWIPEAEKRNQCAVTAFPESDTAQEFTLLAQRILGSLPE